MSENLKSLLRRLEWSGSVAEQPYYMGGPTPGYARACPLCGGIDPSDPKKNGFIESAHGHKPGCELAEAIAAE